MPHDAMLPVYLAQLQAHLERQLRFVRTARAILDEGPSDSSRAGVAKPPLGELIVDVMNTNRLVAELTAHARAAADRRWKAASAAAGTWPVEHLLAQLDDVRVHAGEVRDSVTAASKVKSRGRRGAGPRQPSSRSRVER